MVNVPPLMNRWLTNKTNKISLSTHNHERTRCRFGFVSLFISCAVSCRIRLLARVYCQFREFEPRRVHKYSYKFVGTSSSAHIELWKAREHELATLDEKSTSSRTAEPYAR